VGLNDRASEPTTIGLCLRSKHSQWATVAETPGRKLGGIIARIGARLTPEYSV